MVLGEVEYDKGVGLGHEVNFFACLLGLLRYVLYTNLNKFFHASYLTSLTLLSHKLLFYDKKIK